MPLRRVVASAPMFPGWTTQHLVDVLGERPPGQCADGLGRTSLTPDVRMQLPTDLQVPPAGWQRQQEHSTDDPIVRATLDDPASGRWHRPGVLGDPLLQQQPHAGQVGHRVHGRAEPVGDVGVPVDLQCRTGIIDLPAAEHQSRCGQRGGHGTAPRSSSPAAWPACSRPPRVGRDNARLLRGRSRRERGWVGGHHGEVLRFRLDRRRPTADHGAYGTIGIPRGETLRCQRRPGSGDGHGGDRACAVEGVSVPVITGAPVPGPDRVWARKPAEDEADRTAGVRNVLDNTQLYAVTTAAPDANERAGVVGRRLRQELRAAQLRVLLGPAAPDACRAARLGCLSIGSSDSTT